MPVIVVSEGARGGVRRGGGEEVRGDWVVLRSACVRDVAIAMVVGLCFFFFLSRFLWDGDFSRSRLVVEGGYDVWLM